MHFSAYNVLLLLIIKSGFRQSIGMLLPNEAVSKVAARIQPIAIGIQDKCKVLNPDGNCQRGLAQVGDLDM
jgi:hypothetical protein